MLTYASHSLVSHDTYEFIMWCFSLLFCGTFHMKGSMVVVCHKCNSCFSVNSIVSSIPVGSFRGCFQFSFPKNNP